MKALMIRDNGLERDASRVEAGQQASIGIIAIDVTAAAGTTLTAQQMQPGGVIRRTGVGIAFTDTLPTAALLSATLTELVDGDSCLLHMSNRTAVVQTLAGGTGVTLVAGSNTTLAANSSNVLMLTRTSATAWTFEIIG